MKNYKIDTIGKINGVVAHDLDYEFTIWGASTAYVNFNPQIIIDSMGVSSMNMGIDGTNIDQYAGLLNEYISYTKNSTYLIIALDIPGGLTNRNSFYQMFNWLHHIDNNRIYECMSDIDKTTMVKLRYIPFYSLTQYDNFTFYHFRRILSVNNEEYHISNHGFETYKDSVFETSNDKNPFMTSIDERSFNKVTDAALRANNKNIKCFVVITPCYSKGLSQITNSKEFIDKVKILNSPNTHVLDFSDCYISKDSSYFKDNTHLNSRGADELTRLLIRNIKTIDRNRQL